MINHFMVSSTCKRNKGQVFGVAQRKIDRGSICDFKNEIENYCRSDVDILSGACLLFRGLLLISTGIDQFQCITIVGFVWGFLGPSFWKNVSRSYCARQKERK